MMHSRDSRAILGNFWNSGCIRWLLRRLLRAAFDVANLGDPAGRDRGEVPDLRALVLVGLLGRVEVVRQDRHLLVLVDQEAARLTPIPQLHLRLDLRLVQPALQWPVDGVGPDDHYLWRFARHCSVVSLGIMYPAGQVTMSPAFWNFLSRRWTVFWDRPARSAISFVLRPVGQSDSVRSTASCGASSSSGS